jgi:hypothetical protein
MSVQGRVAVFVFLMHCGSAVHAEPSQKLIVEAKIALGNIS